MEKSWLRHTEMFNQSNRNIIMVETGVYVGWNASKWRRRLLWWICVALTLLLTQGVSQVANQFEVFLEADLSITVVIQPLLHLFNGRLTVGILFFQSTQIEKKKAMLYIKNIPVAQNCLLRKLQKMYWPPWCCWGFSVSTFETIGCSSSPPPSRNQERWSQRSWRLSPYLHRGRGKARSRQMWIQEWNE